ncbi:competence protein ComK [Jeotgalibacillus sp. ET6]|uniref:competence protein ComK n=1 Tax=Jeotgalibacillus sp. ET6 TaxID=3037260 RepID=UPI0024184DF6|nr:competence protein ComK [Jeotgalibacillus sp. ET6]MDG5473434.1 competence protein ComK [Jeotgalibacillus sp. ET6]
MEDFKRVDSYIIHTHTMLLEPWIEGKEKKTIIYEKNAEPIIAEKQPQEIIQSSCLYFLSSYEGRKLSTKSLTNIRHKPPIVIDPVTGVYFYSTHSDTNPHNHWVSLKHTHDQQACQGNYTKVLFIDGSERNLPVSYQSFVQQYYKASHLFCKAQLNLDEIREKTEPEYTVERQANRLMIMEYLNRIERNRV